MCHVPMKQLSRLHKFALQQNPNLIQHLYFSVHCNFQVAPHKGFCCHYPNNKSFIKLVHESNLILTLCASTLLVTEPVIPHILTLHIAANRHFNMKLIEDAGVIMVISDPFTETHDIHKYEVETIILKLFTTLEL